MKYYYENRTFYNLLDKISGNRKVISLTEISERKTERATILTITPKKQPNQK